MNSIEKNLHHVRQRIEGAAMKAGRDPNTITLVAVSKLKPAPMIREAYGAGQRAFGENYAQDMVDKAKQLADLDIEWHFIGHLQRNKAKIVAPIAACVESVDSVPLAEALDRRAGRPLDILIEVNIGQEETKAGVAEDDLPPLIADCTRFKRLNLKGLMIIPPYMPDPEASRPYFQKLRTVLERINEQKLAPHPLTELSMGMSHDFEVAIEEGATMVRVGTAIFGERETR